MLDAIAIYPVDSTYVTVLNDEHSWLRILEPLKHRLLTEHI